MTAPGARIIFERERLTQRVEELEHGNEELERENRELRRRLELAKSDALIRNGERS